MFKWKYMSRREAAIESELQHEERREDLDRCVFQEAILTIEDFYKIRAVITDLGERSARVQYATRRDLPFRVRVHAPGLKLKCWARVAWQRDGAAGLEFLPPEEAPLL
jgi:hypothetical protein